MSIATSLRSARSTSGRDMATEGATAVVVASAGLSSWSGWVDLAEAVHWGALAGVDMAWFLPVSVDVFAFIAARTWLSRGHEKRTQNAGLASALVALVLSVAGNAAGHAAAARVWTPTWPAVVAVAAIPPVLLFVALLLRTLRRLDERAAEDKAAARKAKRDAHVSPSAPAAPVVSAVTELEPRTSRGAAVQAVQPDKVRVAYDTAVAAGRITKDMTTKAAEEVLATQFGVSTRTIRRHLASYRPSEQKVAADGH